jgi:hypothetical protein
VPEFRLDGAFNVKLDATIQLQASVAGSAVKTQKEKSDDNSVEFVESLFLSLSFCVISPFIHISHSVTVIR